MSGSSRPISPETLAALLEVWGISANNARAVKAALKELEHRRAGQALPPVIVAWDSQPAELPLNIPAEQLGRRPYCLLQYEDGRVQALGPLHSGRVRLPALPFGYHRLRLEVRGQLHQAFVISSPSTSFTPAGQERRWGLFAPLYALHTRHSWGAGNLGDWDRLNRFAAARGGQLLATLPLTAAFLEKPFCEPSPYSPASRLFWNEFYLDVPAIPEFAHCKAAQKLVQSPQFQAQLAAFQAADLLDYRAQAELRRKVLSLLAAKFFAGDNPRRSQFEQFLQRRSRSIDYAQFRATCDAKATPWQTWDERLQRGKLESGDYAEADRDYYLYTQWVTEEQICKLAGKCRSNGARLALDLPLGVHSASYDVWRERDLFAPQVSVGAPPDLFFTKGQNWGFPPLQPERLRELHYGYWLEYLRFHLANAGLLRLDHIMGLHRLYWIPTGFPADQGAYVTYPAEEFYAMLCLESHRHQTVIQGENLGTVPPEVNQAMARHRFRQTYVLQYQQHADPHAALLPPPAESVASLNTHDLPTFAAHWNGLDLDDRQALSLLTSNQLNDERQRRALLNSALAEFLRGLRAQLSRGSDLSSLRKRSRSRLPIKPHPDQAESSSVSASEMLSACLRWLAASDAEFLLLNLEDLWLETKPQNVPGTTTERPNWLRKARLALEQIEHMPQIRELLSSVNRLRQTKLARKKG